MRKKLDLKNKKFGKLKVIKIFPKNNPAIYWECLCDCGNKIIVKGYSLKIGKTKSCGCLRFNNFKLTNHSKYSLKESLARKVWRNRYSEIEFYKFFKLSQESCYYCGSSPKLNKNNIYYYNTLDRIDSNLSHTIDNVVPCCLTCNNAKLNRNLEEFYQYVQNLQINIIKVIIDNKYNLNDLNKYQLITLKRIFYRYNDGDLNLNNFYNLIKKECYYCGVKCLNKTNLAGKDKNGTLIYNGLDRIDNNFPHNLNNVVPCCKYCNTAKNNLTLQEFYSWIKKVKNYLFLKVASNSG